MTGMTKVIGTAAIVLAAACGPKAESAPVADPAAESAAARTAIEASNQQFMAHFNAGHGDSVAAIYTENGKVMAPNMAAAVGRADIAKSMGMMGGATLALTTDAVVASGTLAVESGTYKITLTPPGMKTPITDTGKYLVHWEKVGDKWMMAHDIWNSDLPAMPMGPPAKP